MLERIIVVSLALLVMLAIISSAVVAFSAVAYVTLTLFLIGLAIFGIYSVVWFIAQVIDRILRLFRRRRKPVGG